MSRSFRLSWPVTLLAILAFVFLSTGHASAHAHLKSSQPAADSTVTTTPSTVVAVFENHSALAAIGSVIKVTDASGAIVDQGDTVLDKSDPDRKTLTVSLKASLPNGVYTVNWTAASEGDGSIEAGSFKFTVSVETAPVVSPTASAPTSLPTTGAAPTLPFEAAMAGAAILIMAGVVLRRRFTAR